jgi:undecaprenyl phosphate-alpha-L-ara4N flippase subunit ArnE
MPLNLAVGLASGQFVAVVLAAAVVLGEPISALRWAGMALIAAGIGVIAWTQPE